MEAQSSIISDIFTKIKQSSFVQKGLELFFQRKLQQWKQNNRILQQEEFFFSYLEGLQETLYRKKIGFDVEEMRNFDDIYTLWKSHIPVWNHDTMGVYMMQDKGTRNEWSLKKRRYALSGGTTQLAGKNKKYIYMPYSIDTLNQDAFQTITAHILDIYGTETLFTTHFLPLGGSIREETEDYIAGDVSALLMQSQNTLIATTIYPYSIEELTQGWEKKYQLFLASLHHRNVGSIMGTTKRVAMMLDEIYSKYPDRRAEIKKTLQCVLRGGVDIEPYRHIFEKLGITNLMGIYNAAEGMIGFQDLSITQGVWYQFLETGFFECIPRTCIKEGNIFDSDLPCSWIGTLTEEIFERYGQDFLLVYSTPGQIRSPMDVLRLQYFGGQLRFQIIGRVGGFINLVGEELLESHARSAIVALGNTLGQGIESWTVAPGAGVEQFHERVIEYSGSKESIYISQFLDEYLQRINGDYADKRQCGWLNTPYIHLVPVGTFDSFHASQGKVGGQTKCLVMSGKREYINFLLQYIMLGNIIGIASCENLQ